MATLLRYARGTTDTLKDTFLKSAVNRKTRRKLEAKDGQG